MIATCAARCQVEEGFNIRCVGFVMPSNKLLNIDMKTTVAFVWKMFVNATSFVHYVRVGE